MKKLYAAAAALLILVSFFAAASAQKELYPFHKLDMETYGEGTSVVSALIHPDQIDEYGCMPYEIYDLDLYRVEDVLALENGDVICVYNDLMTVGKVARNDSEITINGGFFFEDGEGDEQGATLSMLEEDPTVCAAVFYEYFSETMIGQAAFQLANPVTVTSYHWGEDGDWDGGYDVAEVAPADFAEYMSNLEANDIFADVLGTTLTLKDGMITEIRIEWHP